MAETLCSGILHRETEFTVAYDPVLKTTQRRFGTCGQQAAHAILTNVLGRYLSTADIYTRMRSASLCDPSGASTASALQAICQAYGAKIAGFRQWTDANWGDWQNTFNQHAGVNPFLFETHAGQQLVDLISGQGENANNLQNHFVAVLGRHTGGFSARANRTLPAGCWCADGASFAGGNSSANGFNAANVLQFYSDTAIAASLPRALVALVGRASAPMAWHEQANKTGRDDKGHVCGEGLMNVLQSRSDLITVDGLMSERYRGGNDSVLLLANGRFLRSHHDAATGQYTNIADDAGGAALLAGIVSDLDAEVAALKQSQNAPLTPKQQAAIALGQALDAYEAVK